MKIRISFAPEEEREVISLLDKIRAILPHMRLKRSDKAPEHRVVYLSPRAKSAQKQH